jgi:hypothetical protein
MAEKTEAEAPKIAEAGHAVIEPHPWNPPALAFTIDALRVAERLMFTVVGVLLFVAGFILALRSIVDIYYLITGLHGSVITLTADFLDIVLLILMIAELAYTVTLSVRGEVLSPTPFLIVGLIAVIRRILVITVQEVQRGREAAQPAFVSQSTIELAILTAVVLAFVFAMRLLRRTS